jgi:hypothetical protein
MLSDNVITDQEDVKKVFTMLWPDMDWTVSRFKSVGQIDPKVMDVLSVNEKRALEGYKPTEDVSTES